MDACLFLLQLYNDSEPINIGVGEDISIEDLATIIKHIIEYKGKILFDKSRPAGVLRKMLDTSKLNALSWKATTSIEDGIKKTYEWYLMNGKNSESVR